MRFSPTAMNWSRFAVWLARVPTLGAFAFTLYAGWQFSLPAFGLAAFGFCGPWFPIYYLAPLSAVLALIALRQRPWATGRGRVLRLAAAMGIVAVLGAVAVWGWHSDRNWFLLDLRWSCGRDADGALFFSEMMVSQDFAYYWAALFGLLAAAAAALVTSRTHYWLGFAWYVWSMPVVTMLAFLSDGASDGFTQVPFDDAATLGDRLPPVRLPPTMTAWALLATVALLVVAVLARRLREATVPDT